MKGDPRDRNVTLKGQKIADERAAYLELYRAGLLSVSESTLDAAVALIEETARQKGRILVAGNGGSAAIANHLTCDFTKGTHHEQHPTLVTESLAANPSLLTALANDFSFEQSFSLQVKMMAKKGDVLILISSSGNSPNILRACEEAKGLGAKVIGMTGFKGGKLKEMADISLHVAVENYGVVEDCHQSLMHIMAQHIAKKRDHK